MVGKTARCGGFAALVLTVALSLAAPSAGAATATDPKSAKAIAALLAARKLGCRDFSSASAPSGTTSSTLPSTLAPLALLLKGANLGTCTVADQQTLLISFKNRKARQSFEGTLADLPCAVVIAALPSSPPTTGSSGSSSSDIDLPLVDVGSHGIVFSTGTAPASDRVDLAQAALAESKISAKIKGKVRTFTYHCA